MCRKAFLLFLAAAATIRAQSSPQLFRRQTDSCSAQGQKECGTGCIDLTDTCCPDKSGGCPVGKYCDLTSNGQYGCCPIGKVCTGPGGVNTLPGGTITVDQTIPPPKPTTLPAGLLTELPSTRPTALPTALPTSRLPQGCPLSQKECGTGCIDLTDTCCPDKSGSCPFGQYCGLASDGQYGCCDNGKTCTGPAGSRLPSGARPTGGAPPAVGNVQTFLPVELLLSVLLFFVG